MTYEPIPGWPDYRISREAVILGKKGNPLKPFWRGSPRSKYLAVSLHRDGKQVTRPIHQLVLETYVGPRPFPKAEGRHLDGNRAHNAVDNLAWGTHQQNVDDMMQQGTHHNASKTHCGKCGREYTPENTYFYPNGRQRQCRHCKRERDRNRDPEYRRIHG